MNGVCFATILPHGDVIPALCGANAPKSAATHLAMLEAGRRLEATKPDTIVIATPHGIRIAGRICIGLTERAAGGLEAAGASVTVDMSTDRRLAALLVDEAMASGIPVAPCIFGTASGPFSRLPLDWGCVIPLWYCGAQLPKPPKVVVVVPDRQVGDHRLVEFGRTLAAAAHKSGKRVAIIASCDWAHAHDRAGPYGYHPDASRFDDTVQDIIRAGDLTKLAGLSPDFVENAKPDGIWQALIIAGALDGVDLQSDLLSYECPTYFGMLVATFAPRG